MQRIKLYNFYGVRFAHFSRNFSATYTGEVFDNIRTDQVYFDNKLYGLGPVLGLASEWMLTDNISIGGDASALYLVGQTEYTFTEKETRNILADTTFYQQSKDIFSTLGTDMHLYFKVDFPMSSNENKLSFKAGYGGVRYIGTNVNRIKRRDSDNTLNFKDGFNIRTFFATVSYFC